MRASQSGRGKLAVPYTMPKTVSGQVLNDMVKLLEQIHGVPMVVTGKGQDWVIEPAAWYPRSTQAPPPQVQCSLCYGNHQTGVCMQNFMRSPPQPAAQVGVNVVITQGPGMQPNTDYPGQSRLDELEAKVEELQAALAALNISPEVLHMLRVLSGKTNT